MKRNKILESIRKIRAKYVDIFVQNSFDLSHRIQFLMDKKGIDQKTLANLLNKKESEISKWMNGSHNFTLKTLAKIEEKLEGKLFEVCLNETDNEENGGFIMMYQAAVFNYEFDEYEDEQETVQQYNSKKSLNIDLEPIADLEPILIN